MIKNDKIIFKNHISLVQSSSVARNDIRSNLRFSFQITIIPVHPFSRYIQTLTRRWNHQSIISQKNRKFSGEKKTCNSWNQHSHSLKRVTSLYFVALQTVTNFGSSDFRKYLQARAQVRNEALKISVSNIPEMLWKMFFLFSWA